MPASHQDNLWLSNLNEELEERIAEWEERTKVQEVSFSLAPEAPPIHIFPDGRILIRPYMGCISIGDWVINPIPLGDATVLEEDGGADDECQELTVKGW